MPSLPAYGDPRTAGFVEITDARNDVVDNRVNDRNAATEQAALTLTAVKRASILLLIAAAAGVVAAFLSREDQSDPPESWSPVEPS